MPRKRHGYLTMLTIKNKIEFKNKFNEHFNESIDKMNTSVNNLSKINYPQMRIFSTPIKERMIHLTDFLDNMNNSIDILFEILEKSKFLSHIIDDEDIDNIYLKIENLSKEESYYSNLNFKIFLHNKLNKLLAFVEFPFTAFFKKILFDEQFIENNIRFNLCLTKYESFVVRSGKKETTKYKTTYTFGKNKFNTKKHIDDFLLLDSNIQYANSFFYGIDHTKEQGADDFWQKSEYKTLKNIEDLTYPLKSDYHFMPSFDWDFKDALISVAKLSGKIEREQLFQFFQNIRTSLKIIKSFKKKAKKSAFDKYDFSLNIQLSPNKNSKFHMSFNIFIKDGPVDIKNKKLTIRGRNQKRICTEFTVMDYLLNEEELIQKINLLYY